MPSTKRTGIVILAAGSSSRLGRPKQLLIYNGKSLLQHAIDTGELSKGDPVIVVLGSNADIISKEVDKKSAYIIDNKDWEEGMASSIRIGLRKLLEISPEADAVIFMVCDQPHISGSILNGLIKIQKSSEKPIVACDYGDTIGPPALFHKTLFDEMMQLKGDVGAKKIIRQHSHDVALFLFTEGKIDIDTNEDYKALKDT